MKYRKKESVTLAFRSRKKGVGSVGRQIETLVGLRRELIDRSMEPLMSVSD